MATIAGDVVVDLSAKPRPRSCRRRPASYARFWVTQPAQAARVSVSRASMPSVNVIPWHMILDRSRVVQRAPHNLPPPHHRLSPPNASVELNQAEPATSPGTLRTVSTLIGRPHHLSLCISSGRVTSSSRLRSMIRARRSNPSPPPASVKRELSASRL